MFFAAMLQSFSTAKKALHDYTASFSFLPALNFTTLRALILMGSPVWGFRPLRAFCRTLENVPKPNRTTFPFFFFNAFVVLSRKDCSAFDAAVLEIFCVLCHFFDQFFFRHIVHLLCLWLISSMGYALFLRKL